MTLPRKAIHIMTTVLRFSRPRASLRALPYAGAAAVTALVLAACGGGGGATTGGGAPAQGSTPAPTTSGGRAGGGGQGQRQPGVTGLIAAVNGSTMQVQTRTEQTAVSWTDSTTFTKTSSGTLADVTVGSCVTAFDMSSAGGSGSTSAPTEVAATNVQVRPASNGECTGGFGGGFGGGPGGGASGAPTAPPTRTGTPGNGQGGNGFGGRVVQGKVTALSGGTITVEETVRVRGQGTATSSATAGTQRTVTVTTSGSTTFTADKAAAATDVTVGECATALGKADDTGAVAATAISLRPATNGSCTGGGGGRGGSGTATTATKAA